VAKFPAPLATAIVKEAVPLSILPDLIRDYCDVLELERGLAEKKEHLRQRILQELTAENLKETRTPYGSAQRTSRFTLTPKREPVLGLLNGEDLYPFARFTPPKVKALLIPTYGRERLLPLFDIPKTDLLVIRRS
jgi:hypothetical protein